MIRKYLTVVEFSLERNFQGGRFFYIWDSSEGEIFQLWRGMFRGGYPFRGPHFWLRVHSIVVLMKLNKVFADIRLQGFNRKWKFETRRVITSCRRHAKISALYITKLEVISITVIRYIWGGGPTLCLCWNSAYLLIVEKQVLVQGKFRMKFV